MPEDLFGIVGTVIASAYHVESVVAEGGFGIVYRARHGGFRAPVALKCLKVPQHLGPEYQARFLEQFRAEAEVMFRLSAATPTVTRPLHVDVMNAPNGNFVPFMVLEWLDGDTLDALIRARAGAGRRPFSLDELLLLLDSVARALERAHHFEGPSGVESIAHCDLKPENIFIANVGGERVPKILDFGVAEVRGAARRAARDGAEVALFTPAYGAPEQWSPRELGETGPWTDVWGLALTLVEALVGEPVIAGSHATVRAQILDPKRRPTPRSHGAVVSDGVEAVFARALVVNPRDRYPDAGAFWRALVEASNRHAEAAAARGPEIPDLVPLARKQSHPEIALGESGPASFDFDDTSGGASLDLDLPADEPRPKRSLAPSNPALRLELPSPAPASPAGAHAGLGVVALAAERGTPSLEPPASLPRVPAPGGATPSLAPVTPRPALRAEGGAKVPGEQSPAAPLLVPRPQPIERSLLRRLVPGLALAASSILLTLLDRVYAAAAGEVFSLGPVRTSWVAAALLVGGLGLCARELVSRS
jgi:serine/threonine-protein kinase